MMLIFILHFVSYVQIESLFLDHQVYHYIPSHPSGYRRSFFIPYFPYRKDVYWTSSRNSQPSLCKTPSQMLILYTQTESMSIDVFSVSHNARWKDINISNLVLRSCQEAFVYPNVSLKTRILNIMTKRPMVTMISNAKLNQPSTMAVVPTPLLTLPFPKSWAMMEAATDAVCCQRTETSTNIEAMNIMASAIWDTGREGKGFTSRSLPEESSSSCHPGKVARSRRQMKANMMAMMLGTVSEAMEQRISHCLH